MDEPNVVKIGCRLPHGPTMELGTPGKPDYRFVQIRGMGPSGRLGVTQIPIEFANAWFKANTNARHVKDGSVYRVK
jgi:hypothetical protein